MTSRHLVKTKDGLWEIREGGTLVEGPCKIEQFSPDALATVDSTRDAAGLVIQLAFFESVAREVRG